MTRCTMRALVLAQAVMLPAALAAQEIPLTSPAGGCRSEIDARLAFGLCPDSTFDFYATGSYRAGVPTPESVLGYPPGSWHTTYGRMERYIAALAAAAPDRVRVFDYGRSVEGQVQHLVAITADASTARLDAIRADLARLSDPRITTAAQASAIVAGLPVVVWLNAANDGNETAAFEAAMQAAYEMAAAEDPRTRMLRDSTLVLINLAHNPESHERMVAWYNAFVMGDPDPAALEHDAPWGMSTNNNHYQFDLNRDALGLVQAESRAVVAEIQRWKPQVFVDLHGETTQFFFPPAADPVNPVFPAQMTEWIDVFGRGNAAAFDQHGWSYYTRDVFDLYYPGYFDTYPALHGATGMTYETDGGGSKGVRWRRDDGTILRFADGIARHFVASLATVETAARNRTARLQDYHAFFAAGLAKARAGGPRSAVLLPGDDPDRAARLATLLLRHGIEVSRTTAEADVLATDYLTGRRQTMRTPTGSYVIDLEQPNGFLAHTLLVADVAMPEPFARGQLEKFARNARRPPGESEGYDFYDVTAWNLPLVMGVPAAWSEERVVANSEALTLPTSMAKAPGGWADESAFGPTGGATGHARSAYVWRSGSMGAIRLLSRLQGEGYNVVVASRPLVVDGTDYPRGSFIARVDRNPATLHDRIAVLAVDTRVNVYGAASAFPDRGVTGTGSEATRSLHAPPVAVLAGEGVGITSYGALWFQLERRVALPFTALRAESVGDGSLDRFGVVILPDGNYGSLRDGGEEAIRGWVERGGTLIAYGGGARWAQGSDLGLRLEDPDTLMPPADTVEAILRRIDAAVPGVHAGDLEAGARPAAPQSVPGAIFRARLDTLHWLTQGYAGDTTAVLVRSLPLRRTTRGANPVTLAGPDRLVVTGFTWPDNTARTYAGSVYAMVERVGDGQVILFAGDPLYRGAFDAPALMLMNAIWLGAPSRPGSEGS